MPAPTFADLPARGPGIKAATSAGQWDVLSKDAIATIHTEPDACEDCKPLDGDTMRMGEAEDTLPVHPNCRCWYTWDWRPELRRLSVTSLLRRASEPFDTTMKTDSQAPRRTKTATASGVVSKTPDGDDEDGEYIRVPISSTSEDRDGDQFSEKGLRDLRTQIKEQPRPVFENHGIGEGGLFGGPRYDWKSIVGTQVDATISDETLYSYIEPNPENERADQLLSYIEAGQAVGFSVGFRSLDHDGDADDGYEFHETDLLETSVVGIQSNPDASVARDTTVGAIAKEAASLDADLDEDTLASAMVSELFARATGGFDAAPDDHDHDAAPVTKDTTTDMTNDSSTDGDDEYATKADVQRIEEKIDALGDGGGSDATDEGGETDKDADGSGLEAKVAGLSDEFAELREAIEGDPDPVDAETHGRKEAPGDDGEGSGADADGDADGGANASEKNAPPGDGDGEEFGEDAEGWM